MTRSAEAPSVSPALARRVPDFFIVGNPKCGTTALYEMLRRHPQIYMPDLKEPWYFANDLLPRFKPQRSGSTPETLQAYVALFDAARPEQRTGEASSSYLRSHSAAQRIAEMRPDARIIAILREPASFLRSLHMQLLRDHVETKQDLREALSLEPARREGKRIPRRCHLPQLLQYSDYVRYVDQLRRYHAVFAPEQVLVLIYDDFRRDNAATLSKVRRLLDVDEEFPVEAMNANETVKRMRSQRLDALVNTVSVGRGPVSRAAKAGVKALIPNQRLRGRALRVTQRKVVYGSPRPADEELMLELRERFRGEVAALSDYLGRDLLTLWGYDSAG
jgi:Sulfotransferase family